MRYLFISGLILLGAIQSAAQRDSLSFQLILIGDAGALTTPVDDFISKEVRTTGVPSAVIFVGDNVYPKGLPDQGHKDRKSGEQILLNQISMASGFGDIYFVPGNHDWKNGHHDGFRYVLNQQSFLDSLRKPEVHLLPRDGCPGPEEVRLAKDLLLK